MYAHRHSWLTEIHAFKLWREKKTANQTGRKTNIWLMCYLRFDLFIVTHHNGAGAILDEIDFNYVKRNQLLG